MNVKNNGILNQRNSICKTWLVIVWGAFASFNDYLIDKILIGPLICINHRDLTLIISAFLYYLRH